MRKHLLNGTVALSLALSACSLGAQLPAAEHGIAAGLANVDGVGLAHATKHNAFLGGVWQRRI